MSTWTHLYANFRYAEPPDDWTVNAIRNTGPQGSEDGLMVSAEGGSVLAHGDLRDMDDTDAPAILAWFVQHCTGAIGPAEAELTIDIGYGPRYRYEWRNEELVKLKGILDL